MSSNSQNTCDELPLVSQLLEPVFYFDIFSYPLTATEIYNFSKLSNPSVTPQRVAASLKKLVGKGYIYQIDEFYLLGNNPDWVTQRKTDNQRADQYLSKAMKMTKLMTFFPYVRAVFISGSLSKNVMPADGDIDYFIVTKPGRLWIARTFLVLFKKLVLLNSHRYFCVNYFIDQDWMEIEEKNRFTATEIATILPLYGKQEYFNFIAANQWIQGYYPNMQARNSIDILPQKRRWTQVFIESVFNFSIGDWLDTFFMKSTIRYWSKKFHNFDPEQFAVALKSRRNVSKHHPQNFQLKVLNAFSKRVEKFEEKHQLSLEMKDN